MDATPDKSFQYGFEGEVGIGQRKTVNTLRLKSVNRLCLVFSGRGGPIRTGGPLHPMQVRYLAALRPDCSKSIIPGMPLQLRPAGPGT